MRGGTVKAMKLQVLGSGCPSCKRLYEMTKQAAADLGLDADVEYVTDIQQILAMGLMSSPVLAVDGKPVIVGFVPGSVDKVKELLKAIPPVGR